MCQDVWIDLHNFLPMFFVLIQSLDSLFDYPQPKKAP